MTTTLYKIYISDPVCLVLGVQYNLNGLIDQNSTEVFFLTLEVNVYI